MKHSGLAAELHVVFSGGSTGEGGGGRGEQRPEKAEPTAASPSEGLSPAQPSPSSPNRLPAVPSCPRMQGHLPWLPGSTSLSPVAWMSICTWQRGEARPEAPHQSAGGRLLSIQLTNPSQAGTVAKPQTAPHTHAQVHPPLPCPHPQTARNRTSLIFLISSCSCLTLEKPSQMSLMLNKEKC